MAWMETINSRVAGSVVGRWFRLDGCGHPAARPNSRFTTELAAGLATFFAMAYIISVNASIVADSGGTCVCQPSPADPVCDSDAAYLLCVQGLKRDVVTATAAISALASASMGVFANLPIALAPGMGLNAYFAYSVVGYHGSGPVPYPIALTAIFVEGFIFFALALLGMRQWLARAIPHSIKVATSVGIGLFLTLIGLTYSQGIGLVVGAAATPTQLAGCPRHLRLDDGSCPSSEKMRDPTLWLGVFAGGFLTALLSMYRVSGAVIMGIVLVSVVSWPRGTPVTLFPYTPLGDDGFAFFKKVVSLHPIQSILNVLQWRVAHHAGQFGLALVTFLYVDILDCTGTLYSMARFAKLVDPVTQDFEGSSVAYMVDGLCISIGALLGVPPVTTFVESGAGISEGGKTGLTALVTGLCFFLSIFFAPIFASIPPWATGCVLVLVGSIMATSVTDINWKYLGDALPAFLAIAIMPFTYSVANGIIAGVCSYILINTLVWLIRLLSRGRLVPHNYADKEPWTWRIPGGFFPPWLVRLCKGKPDFWRAEPRPVDTAAHELKLGSDPDASSDADQALDSKTGKVKT